METSELDRRIGAEIDAAGAIPFSRFWERALHEPGLGYYRRPAARIGRDGDFVTAPALAPAFGRTLAGLLPLLAGLAGEGPRHRVIDAGAGEGHLLAGVASSAVVSGARDRFELVLVEAGAGLRERAQARLTALGQPAVILESLDELAALPRMPGLVIANELFDALPARWIRRTAAGLEECWVEKGSGGLVMVWRPIPVDAGLPPLATGQEATLAPGDETVLAALSAGIAAGIVLVIDYGYPAAVLYGPESPGNPPRGFLRGVLAPDLLAEPGTIDLTAHVDMSRLASLAGEVGLETLFFTDQVYLLLALGALDDPEPRSLRRLLHPEDMGGAFKCLALGKGVDPEVFRALGVRDRRQLLERPVVPEEEAPPGE